MAMFSGVWKQFMAKCCKADVFFDSQVVESCEWLGFTADVKNSGARCVLELSSFEVVGSACRKAVFLLSDFNDCSKLALRDIIKGSGLQYVLVFIATDFRLHLFQRKGTFDADVNDFSDSLEEEILMWLGDMNFTVEVVHLPLHLFSVSPGFILRIGSSDFVLLLVSDCERIETLYNWKKFEPSQKISLRTLTDVSVNLLPAAYQLEVMRIVADLNDFCEVLNVADDCWAIGANSRLIAQEFVLYAGGRNRRKTAPSKASVILLDSSLDVLTTVGHAGQSVLDMAVSCLPPRRGGHRVDVAIDMSPLSVTHTSGDSILASGSMADISIDSSASSLLRSAFPIAVSKTCATLQKIIDLSRWSSESIEGGSSGSVAALRCYLSLFRKHPDAFLEHCCLLQLACLLVQLDSGGHVAKWSELAALEKLVFQNFTADASPAEAVRLVIDRLRQCLELPSLARSFNLTDLICVLAYCYNLMEQLPSASDREVQTLLVEWLMAVDASDPLFDAVDSIIGSSRPEDKVVKAAATIAGRLRSYGSSRATLTQLRSVVNSGSDYEPATYIPLTSQIAGSIVKRDHVEDLQFMSSGLKDLFKSSLSWFKTVSKPQPMDNPSILFVIVGGTTATEANRLLQTFSAAKTDRKVHVLTSTVMTKHQFSRQIIEDKF